MHTLNENFLSIFAFRCYDENMIATLGINIRDSRNYGFIPSSYPSFGYWYTFLHEYTTGSYCGITLATGSHTTTNDWYTLNGPLVSSTTVVNKVPTV